MESVLSSIFKYCNAYLFEKQADIEDTLEKFDNRWKYINNLVVFVLILCIVDLGNWMVSGRFEFAKLFL